VAGYDCRNRAWRLVRFWQSQAFSLRGFLLPGVTQGGGEYALPWAKKSQAFGLKKNTCPVLTPVRIREGPLTAAVISSCAINECVSSA
jgi:hypothetical protein